MPQTPPSALEDEELQGKLETLLFITDHPLPLEEIGKLTGSRNFERLSALLGNIRQNLEERRCALQLLEVAGGFQMATRPAYGPLVRKLFADKMTMRLSAAAHETLAIIAYKQPLTRAEIEEIRGVEVIAALETLLEKRLIKVVGRKESVGRPLLYGTTDGFMRHFGLKSLEDLPPIEDFRPPESARAPEPAVAAQKAPGAPVEPAQAAPATIWPGGEEPPQESSPNP